VVDEEEEEEEDKGDKGDKSQDGLTQEKHSVLREQK